MRVNRLLPALVCLVALAAACAPGPKARPPLESQVSLAVAGFTNPQHNWELVVGCLPEQCNVVQPENLEHLDAVLTEELIAAKRSYLPLSVTRQCKEIVLREEGSARTAPDAAMSYWIKVGRCIPADYLLLPQLIYYQDRVGGSLGVEKAASVTVYFYLIDAKNQTVAGKYYYDETQKSLSQNLLDADKFFARGGKWVTADDLVREAVRAALKEFRL